MPFMIKVDIVSAEAKLFSGKAEKVFVTGVMGELEIAFGHTQLLTALKPGHVRLKTGPDQEEIFFISGGFLEVQPDTVTILADVARRAKDLDEVQAQEAQNRAKQLLADKKTDLDYAKALAELAEATAQLDAIRLIRKKARL